MCKAKIKEYFKSIQGEGPYIGYMQLFIRFCNCNLRCKYCDTDFSEDGTCYEYTPETLLNELKSNSMFENIHSISLTGGEPLLQAEFLSKFLPLLDGKYPIYLETNATSNENLKKIINYVDIISADIKLPSSAGYDLFSVHDDFFKICAGKNIFAKVVFDEKMTTDELMQVCKLGKKYNFEIIFSPVMKDDKPTLNSSFMKETLLHASKQYPKVRLIPQVHKFLYLE